MKWVGRWLVLTMLLCPLQLYAPSSPLGSASVLQASLAPLLMLLLLAAVRSPERPFLPLMWPLIILVLLVALCLVAVAWSPVRRDAVLTAVKLGGVVLIAVAAGSVDLPYRRMAVRTLAIMAVGLAFMVIVFRLYPLLEAGFLFTHAANLTIDPDLLAGLRSGTERINTMAPERAGGVFTNANSAALFMGLVMVLAWTVLRQARSWLIAATVVLVAGIFATGSKAALVALILTTMVVGTYSVRRYLTLRRAMFALIGALAGATLLIVMISRQNLVTTAQVSGATRFQIWTTGVPVLLEHPLLGLGFGGWEKWVATEFRYAGVAALYPPQNLLLIAWAWAGFPGFVLMAAFTVTLLLAPWRPSIRETVDGPHRLGLFLVFIWFVLQSMFSNASLTDIRIGVPMGLALGSLIAASDQRPVFFPQTGEGFA